MLSAERVRQLLDYDPATGIFTWKTKPGAERYIRAWNSSHAGKVAGRTKPNGHGYMEIAIDNVLYKSAILAWVWMTGEWPEGVVDHKDRNKTNDRWENLRQATVAQNAWNTGRQKRNTTGFKGVTLYKPTGRYCAQIRANKKTFCLGYFATAEEAHAAYVAAATKYHGEFARAA